MRTDPVPHSVIRGAAGRLPAAAPDHPSSLPPERQEALKIIAALKERIARQEGHRYFEPGRSPGRNSRRPEAWTFGLPEIDRHLPDSGLMRTALHDIAPEAYGDFPAASAFALALASRLFASAAEHRPMLWCRLESERREYGQSYGHGLEDLGLPRERFLTLTLRKPVSLFWVMEEALKSKALALVICDAAPQQFDLTVSRRLSLACAKGRAAGILTFAATHKEATASATRWRIKTESSPSLPLDMQSPGTPTWTVSLIKARNGRQGLWTVTWQKNHVPPHFSLVSGFRHRTLPPHTAEDQADPQQSYAEAHPGLRTA